MKKKNKIESNKLPKNKWFAMECKQIRKEPKQIDPIEEKENYYVKYKKYKRVTQKKKRGFQYQIISEIQSTNDSAKMWSLLKKNTKTKVSLCPIDIYIVKKKMTSSGENFECNYFIHDKEEEIIRQMKTFLEKIL